MPGYTLFSYHISQHVAQTESFDQIFSSHVPGALYQNLASITNVASLQLRSRENE